MGPAAKDVKRGDVKTLLIVSLDSSTMDRPAHPGRHGQRESTDGGGRNARIPCNERGAHTTGKRLPVRQDTGRSIVLVPQSIKPILV